MFRAVYLLFIFPPKYLLFMFPAVYLLFMFPPKYLLFMFPAVYLLFMFPPKYHPAEYAGTGLFHLLRAPKTAYG